MLRVTFITHCGPLYGANRSLLALLDGLPAHGVEVSVIAPEAGGIVEAARTRNIPVEIIPLEWWVHGREPMEQGPILFRSQLRRLVRQARSNAYFLRRNIKLVKPLVNFIRQANANVIYTNSSMTPIGAMASLYLRLPHVWHLREFNDLDYGNYFDLGESFSRFIISKADAVIAISKAIAKHYGVTFARNSHMVHNGVASLAEFDRLRCLAEAAPSTKADRYVFCLVGLIWPTKGQEAAIRALSLVAKEYPGARLSIVGKGNVEHLEKLATELGIRSNVEFQGHVNDPFNVFLGADAALMCSEHEGMGRVTAEAMAACRPVIGLDSGGTSEIIEHEQTGLLYRGGCANLASCMRRFIQNPGWARSLGMNGWRQARERFCNEKYVSSIYDVLQSVAPASQKPARFGPSYNPSNAQATTLA